MLPRISITSTDARIDVRSTRARIERRSAESMPVMSGNGKAIVNRRTTMPRVRIDQTESFAQSGNKTVFRLANDFYSASFQKGMENIDTIVREGMEFLAIENIKKGSYNPIHNQAMQKGRDNTRLVMDGSPRILPETTLLPGTTQVVGIDNQFVDISWQHAESSYHYVPAEVTVQVVQYPSIHTEVIPGEPYEVLPRQ